MDGIVYQLMKSFVISQSLPTFPPGCRFVLYIVLGGKKKGLPIISTYPRFTFLPSHTQKKFVKIVSVHLGG